MKTRIITIIACLLSLTAGRAADRLQVENITIKPSEVKELKLSLALDNEKYAGVQFDIQLPTGLSLGVEGSGVYYALAGIQPNDLECKVTGIQEGTYRFMLYSSSLKMLKSGEMMTLRLEAEKGMELREYTLRLNDVMLSDIDGAVTKLGSSTATVKLTDFFNLTYMVDGEHYKTVEYEYGATITPEAEPKKDGYTFSGWSNIPQTMPAYDVTVTGYFTQDKKPGDANGDGTVNAADIVEVVNYIMNKPSWLFDASAADVNGDGVVNAADIVEIVNIIMGK